MLPSAIFIEYGSLPQVAKAFDANTCPNCGPWECYHICPNSPYYYSPEQEREDDRHYDPSEYYREGGFADPDYYPDEEY